MPGCLWRKQTVATFACLYWLHWLAHARTSLSFAPTFDGDNDMHNHIFPGWNHIRGCRHDSLYLLVSVLYHLLFYIKM